jgi:hypothetical protein
VVEEDDVEEKVVILDEEDEEVELYVDGNVLDDHIENKIIENDINDDAAMPNSFNANFEPDDTYVELEK